MRGSHKIVMTQRGGIVSHETNSDGSMLSLRTERQLANGSAFSGAWERKNQSSRGKYLKDNALGCKKCAACYK